jgi:hypothetical protein
MRWGRIVGLAFALEAALFAALVPLQSLLSQRAWFVTVAVICALFSYIAGRLVARGLSSGAVQHGLLVGVIATIIYIAICMLGTGGLPAAVAFYGAPLYVSLNALRIAGCIAGAGTSQAAKTVLGRSG